MDDTKELLSLKKLELLDITCDWTSISEPIKSTEEPALSHSRKKRNLVAPDLRQTLVDMIIYINGVSGAVLKHSIDHRNTTEINNKIYEDIKKKVIRQTLHTKIVAIEKMIEAIIAVQMQNKLNNHLVSFEEFQKLLMNVTAENPLGENEEIPFDSIHKYFYSLKTMHEVNQVSEVVLNVL